MLALAIIATIALVVVAASAVVSTCFVFLAMRAVAKAEQERRNALAASVESLLSQQASIDALAKHFEHSEDDTFGLMPFDPDRSH
jgi:anionic cell wall polymer biosynthesis LytR-Cps2A-Psr (LCP) family protein